MEITEYGDRPFVEGIMEHPLNLFIVLGGFALICATHGPMKLQRLPIQSI